MPRPGFWRSKRANRSPRWPAYISVASKGVLRAMLKAAEICSTDPARVAQQMVKDGITPRYDYALESLRQLPYDKWREYDPEDTLRFYAVRLHEAGMVKSTPQKIIAE